MPHLRSPDTDIFTRNSTTHPISKKKPKKEKEEKKEHTIIPQPPSPISNLDIRPSQQPAVGSDMHDSFSVRLDGRGALEEDCWALSAIVFLTYGRVCRG